MLVNSEKIAASSYQRNRSFRITAPDAKALKGPTSFVKEDSAKTKAKSDTAPSLQTTTIPSRPTMSKPSETVFLSHIISQTQANVSFLAAHNYISGTDASDILNRLAEAQAKGIASNSTTTLANSVSSLSIVGPPQPSITPPPARRAVPPPPPRYQRAKALWAYNEDGRVSTFT